MTPKDLVAKPFADGFYFGESPRYRDGTLYMSDMTGRKIYAIDEHTGAKKVLLEMENQPNGMAFADDGSLICSSMFDAKLYRVDVKEPGGKKTLYADMSGVMTGYCGDMVIDRHGRVFLDDTGKRVLHGETPGPGRLLRIEKDGGVHVAEENIVFPNALCISPDGKTLYNAESFGYGLYGFDLAEDGTLSDRRQVWTPASLFGEREPRSPSLAESMIGIDGGCIDAEGCIWLGLLALEQFVRLDPASGQISHRIKVEGHAVACTLGGEDGKTLFMAVNATPADQGLFKAMVALETRGSVWKARVDVPHGEARP